MLPEVLGHYADGVERDRLDAGMGRLERIRTQELLERWLPPAPAVVLDVGGGPGNYAVPLAAAGYAVHLLDPVPLHAEQAVRSGDRLASVSRADARAVPFGDATVDAVLLMGPLYHLVDRTDRLAALREAGRVVRPGGVVVVAVISRWASALSGVHSGFLREEEFARIVADDLATGVHRNPGNRPGWFTTTYFHRPEELTAELEEAGLAVDGPVGVEGLGGAAPDIDALLDDDAARERVLDVLRRTEREPALLGMSSHLLAAGRRP
jgi:SAM-dependent methyltransferase